MVRIINVKSRQILDSRGNPTIETEITTKKGVSRASVPSGASTGVHEALELRDGGKAYGGKGVSKAIKNVLSLRKELLTDWNQGQLDRFLIKKDGTPNKSKLGANAILSISMAFCKAAALENNQSVFEHVQKISGARKVSLPLPAFNVINGGAHAGNKLDIQEYMVLPTGAKTFKEAYRIGSEIYHQLKKLLKADFGKEAINVGDEGGFAPPLTCYTEPFDYIERAADELGYGKKIKLGIDAAASEFFKNGSYSLEGKKMDSMELLDKYIEVIRAYPLATVEDPFDQEDFDSFAKLKKKSKIQIVGDDLTVTNPKRIRKAITKKSCNALLLKVNQIGSITEALKAAALVKKNKWGVMVSHRSGETTDSFIADLAVGMDAGQIKSGAPCRGERLAKYNQLLRIEELLGKKAKFSGALK